MSNSKKADTKKFAALTAEDLFGRGGYTMLEIPELPKGGRPGVVWLRPLSAGDVMDFTARVGGDEKPESEKTQAMLEMIASAVVNEDGSAIFTEEQVGRLREMSMSVFSRLATAVNELTGAGKKDAAGKDSSATASGDSPSA